MLDAGLRPIILDVRSRFEFSTGHLPFASHFPFWKTLLLAGRFIPDKASDVVLYCEHGPRAQLAQVALAGLGYRQVKCLQGHMHQWRREKRKLIQ